MKVKLSTKGVFSKSLMRLATCSILMTGAGYSPLWAASGNSDKPEVAVSQQQTVTITGKILGEDGDGLPGVNVVVKGTTIGTVTDGNGIYSLKVETGSTLSFSYLGYLTKEVTVGKNLVINVTLSEDTKIFDEVVVIGYGTQKKGDVTSAVASVKAENFTKGMVRDAGDLIKGKVAGLTISNGSGDPSVTSSIMLRGLSSLKGGSSPLVLINGMPGGLNTVAPEDIESIDVLKDASAAAIYGTRGANGVILITTKSGKQDMKPEVTYSSYVSVSKFDKKADFMDADDIRQLIKEGKTSPFADLGASTNWLDEISGTGWTQNHSLSLRGGSEHANYAGNITYLDRNGVFNGTGTTNFKASFDVNQYAFNDIVKFNLNVVKGIDKTPLVGGASSFDPMVYRQALTFNPTAAPKNADGSWYQDFQSLEESNPLAMTNESDGEDKSEYTRLAGNITITPIKGWENNLMVANRSKFGTKGYYETKQNISNTKNGKNGAAKRWNSNDETKELEFTSKYNKTLGVHRISALAGYSYSNNIGANDYLYNYDFPTDAFTYNNIESGGALAKGKAEMTSEKSESTLVGFFGRVSYAFSDRFNVLASIRREGSSKFGENNKWGNFPSVSLGWTISNESFMKDFDFINNLKLRAGYGVTGVIPNDPYLSKTVYEYKDWVYLDGKWTKGLSPTSNPNPDLKWETSKEINIGVDYSVLNNRIYGSVDIYNKKTTDMLWDYTVPVPPNLVDKTLANVGEMSNKGIEIALSLVPVKSKDWEWTSSFTVSHNKNELVSLSNDLYKGGSYVVAGGTGDPIQAPTHIIKEGEPLGNFWGFKSVDVTDDGHWIIENKDGQRIDFDADGGNAEANKQVLGNGIPKVIGGWVNTVRYKNLDLSVVMNGAFGFQILNFQRMYYENPNIKYNMLRSAFDKVYGKAVLASKQQYMSYYIEDGDYVKIDNITLGYTLPHLKFNYIKSVRVYVSGQNLACFTKYKGLDPEVYRNEPLAQGNDSRDKYPTTRTFTCGLNVTF